MATNKFAHHAADLEACLPPPSSAARAATTGIIPAVLALIDALKAGDIAAIATAFLNLLQILLANPSQNATAAANVGINWGNLIQILVKILPLIFA